MLSSSLVEAVESRHIGNDGHCKKLCGGPGGPIDPGGRVVPVWGEADEGDGDDEETECEEEVELNFLFPGALPLDDDRDRHYN